MPFLEPIQVRELRRCSTVILLLSLHTIGVTLLPLALALALLTTPTGACATAVAVIQTHTALMSICRIGRTRKDVAGTVLKTTAQATSATIVSVLPLIVLLVHSL